MFSGFEFDGLGCYLVASLEHLLRLSELTNLRAQAAKIQPANKSQPLQRMVFGPVLAGSSPSPHPTLSSPSIRRANAR
ncbi:MAG: hypothetical protein WAW52_05420 [Methanothrix sp.]